jgi:hypothetical protein
MRTDRKIGNHNWRQSNLCQNKIAEESSFFGRAYFELNFGENIQEYFIPYCFKIPKTEIVEKFQKHVTPAFISSLLAKSRRYDTKPLFKNDKKNLPNQGLIAASNEQEKIADLSNSDWGTIGVHDLSKRLQNIDLVQLEHEAGKMGYRTIWYRNHFGSLDFYLANAENLEIYPRFFLIESYRISTFPLDYNAGRIIKTLSLAPAEKAKLFVTSYKNKDEGNSSSCILDSISAESVHEFQNCLNSENYNWDSYQAAIDFQFNTEVDSLLFATSTPFNSPLQFNLNRIEFIKNTWKALSKHVSRAATKREIQINSEINFNINNDNHILREISNPNSGSTVNYNFKQLYQEFLTLIQLSDIRIGYTNGIITEEYPLHLLDNVLENYILPEKQKEVCKNIINTTMSICDYKNETILDKGVIQEMSAEGKTFHYFNSHCQSTYFENDELEIKTSGIILSANKFILPVESFIIESQLGEDDIQDIHIREIQGEELREKRLKNDMKEREVEKLNLAASIVKDTTPEKAKLFDEVFNKYDNHDK